MSIFIKLKDCSKKLRITKNHKAYTQLELVIDDVRAYIYSMSAHALKGNEKLIEEFYISLYDCQLQIYGALHLPLQELIIEGAQYNYFKFFRYAVARQIALTDYIQKRVKNADENTFKTYTETFVSNIYVLTNLIKKFPTAIETPVIKKIIGEYLNAYADFRSDAGCTLALPQYVISTSKNVIKAEPSLAKNFMAEQNCIELRRFFTHAGFTSSHEHTYGLHKSLENLQTFLASLKYVKGKLVTTNIEILIDAIRVENIVAIKVIVLFDPAIIGKTCPLIMQVSDVGFTPLMLAAKTCREAATIEQGLFAGIPDLALRKLHIRSKTDTDNNNYNSLSIAARYGSPEVFSYLVSVMATEITSEIAILLLEGICSNYLVNEEVIIDKSMDPKLISTEIAKLKLEHAQNRKTLLTNLLGTILKSEANFQQIFGEYSPHDNTISKLKILSQIKKLHTSNVLTSSPVVLTSKRKRGDVTEPEQEQKQEPEQAADTGLSTSAANIVRGLFGCKRNKSIATAKPDQSANSVTSCAP